MKVKINRYNLEKELIATGELNVLHIGKEIKLIYSDNEINVECTAIYHPLKSLEKLRLALEKNHSSLLNIMGCRIDTAYRPTGGTGSYLLELGKEATNRVHIFDPTNEIKKLCTVKEHIKEYEKWCNHFN